MRQLALRRQARRWGIASHIVAVLGSSVGIVFILLLTGCEIIFLAELLP